MSELVWQQDAVVGNISLSSDLNILSALTVHFRRGGPWSDRAGRLDPSPLNFISVLGNELGSL